MLNNKEWVYNQISEERAKKLSEDADISTLLARIFLNRGIDDVSYIKKFLKPSIEDMYDPFLMADMEVAVDRIIKAIDSREKIIVYGDYDVDGVTSTSILVDFLSSRKAVVDFYIPDRQEEGYGLSLAAVDKILQTGVSLIITVDCGITAVDEVRYIKQNNIDIIITDHHQCKDVLPESDAVINPCRTDCPYPFKQLAGVGVAYKLIHALCIRMELGDYHNNYLEMVALGTVADVVPLIDENRAIVMFGISKIEKTQNTGLRALINNSGLKDKTITSAGLSFIISPRINAAGRIGDAGRAVKLFTIEDEEEALSIALKLNEENKFRQDTEMGILKQVMETVESEINLEEEKVIVVSGEGWHHGIIGIVASKVTERFYRPCILINNEDGIGKGSGRSIEGFNIFHALCRCTDLLDKFGGHELAAGLSLKTENIVEFRKRINEYADEVLEEYHLVPKLKIDACIGREDINIDYIKELDLLAPFGAGNPAPVFAYTGLRVSDIRTVGENKHLKLRLEDQGLYIDAIGFNMASLAQNLTTDSNIEAACLLEVNTWNSIEKAQLHLSDLRLNRDVLMENSYYYSLEKSLGLTDIMISNSSELPDFKKYRCLGKDEELEKFICDAINDEKRIAVFVNNLGSAKRLDKIFKKTAPTIKKCFEICYTNFYDNQKNSVCAVVNPVHKAIVLDSFDYVVLLGAWIDKGCLNALLCRCNAKDVIFFIDDGCQTEYEAIVPTRLDLASVYQCLKSCVKAAKAKDRHNNRMVIDDLFAWAEKISGTYNIQMNYFKLMKCLDIFEELQLLSKETAGEYGVSVVLYNGIKEKVSLDSSKLYISLQELKNQRN